MQNRIKILFVKREKNAAVVCFILVDVTVFKMKQFSESHQRNSFIYTQEMAINIQISAKIPKFTSYVCVGSRFDRRNEKKALFMTGSRYKMRYLIANPF